MKAKVWDVGNLEFSPMFSIQGSRRLEKYLNLQDCLEKSLKIKFALKSTIKHKNPCRVLEFYHLQEDSTLALET